MRDFDGSARHQCDLTIEPSVEGGELVIEAQRSPAHRRGMAERDRNIGQREASGGLFFPFHAPLPPAKSCYHVGSNYLQR